MFEQILKNLQDQGGGVRAYEACANSVLERIGKEPDNAAALFLLGVAAQRFVDSYDDQPLSTEAASGELELFKSCIATLNEAYASGSAERKVSALNEVATRIAQSVPR